jgi:hypothetical protein
MTIIKVRFQCIAAKEISAEHVYQGAKLYFTTLT